MKLQHAAAVSMPLRVSHTCPYLSYSNPPTYIKAPNRRRAGSSGPRASAAERLSRHTPQHSGTGVHHFVNYFKCLCVFVLFIYSSFQHILQRKDYKHIAQLGYYSNQLVPVFFLEGIVAVSLASFGEQFRTTVRVCFSEFFLCLLSTTI